MTVTVTTLEEETYQLLGLHAPSPDMTPYRYYFNDFMFGAGTDWIVESVTGLLGWDATSTDTRSSTGPGSIPGLLTMNSKQFTVNFRKDSSRNQVENDIAELKHHLTLPPRGLNVWVGDYANRGFFTDRATWFQYMRPGFTEPRIIFCRVSKIGIDSNYDTTTGDLTVPVQFDAPDPLSYGLTTKLVTIPSGQSYTFTQEGDYRDGYAPFCRIHGPFTNPSLQRSYTNFYYPSGRTQKVTYHFSYADLFTVDMRNRACNPLGAGLTVTDDEFWTIQQGEQTLHYTGGGSCDFLFRSVWS